MHPEIYDQFTKILNKKPEDHSNFLKAYNVFANHKDDIEIIKKISIRLLL